MKRATLSAAWFLVAVPATFLAAILTAFVLGIGEIAETLRRRKTGRHPKPDYRLPRFGD